MLTVADRASLCIGKWSEHLGYCVGAKLDFLTLAFMASVAIYAVLSFVKHSLRGDGKTDKEGEV